mgnify:CR=1 FL=1|tara:strand:+ start:375 stop:548 length:174 start_codon:yes stop_codon:yes gene_type:complete
MNYKTEFYSALFLSIEEMNKIGIWLDTNKSFTLLLSSLIYLTPVKQYNTGAFALLSL